MKFHLVLNEFQHNGISVTVVFTGANSWGKYVCPLPLGTQKLELLLHVYTYVVPALAYLRLNRSEEYLMFMH